MDYSWRLKENPQLAYVHKETPLGRTAVTLAEILVPDMRIKVSLIPQDTGVQCHKKVEQPIIPIANAHILANFSMYRGRV